MEGIEEAWFRFEGCLRGLLERDGVGCRISESDQLARRIEMKSMTVGENNGFQTPVFGFQWFAEFVGKKIVCGG